MDKSFIAPDPTLFYQEVYDIVREIPPGRVLTYGRIAALAGWPAHARMAGRALREAPEALHLPCHRVVNSSGRTAPLWPEQALLLQAEGVLFRKNGQVDLRACLWDIDSE